MQFKEYIYIQEYGGIYLPENWAREIGKMLPKLGLDLPTVEKQARIDILLDKQNPIYIQLSDNSKLFFTFDEYERIEGTPKPGKTLAVLMQRNPHDKSNNPSQIVSCRVI